MKSIGKISFPALALLGLAISGCKPELDVPQASAGSATFARYVALGNSLTAGYADGAWYREGQEASYPKILAQQFSLVGGGNFNQPLLAPGVSYGFPGTNPQTGLPEFPKRKVLGVSTSACPGVQPSLGPIDSGAPTPFSPAVLAPPANPGPYNNMGVPGAKSFHVISPGYGNAANLLPPQTANPFFVRFASEPNTTVLKDAVSQNPTFFTMWLGINDVLFNALSGGTGGTGTDLYDITPQPVFNAAIDSVLHHMTMNNRKGAVANIPNVTSIPFFTRVPYNGLALTAAQATALTAAYQPLGITFTEGANPFIIADAAAPGGLRKIKPTELVLLNIPQDSLRCGGWGSQDPIPDEYVLTEAELQEINTATIAYNQKLKAAAEAKGLAFFDANAMLASLQQGPVYSYGVSNPSAFVTGIIFSLDGIHLTPRGNAIVANEFIRAINGKYGANIPQVNPNDYPGVKFP